MALDKVQLEEVNQSNFPNNHQQLITPSLLREFNTDMIVSLVDEIRYNEDSASWNEQIALIDPSGSVPAILGLEQWSASAKLEISALEQTSQSLNEFTQSQIVLNGTFATTGSNTFYGDQTLDKEYVINTKAIYWNNETEGYTNLEIANTGYGNLDLGALNGRVRIVGTPLLLTGSALTSSNDISTSANIYAANLTGSGNIDTGSFATTGSNTFDGAQTISGSNGILTYTGNSSLQPNGALASIHSVDDGPWLERFYNDSFSSQSSVMSYFGWNDGRFVFHNDSTQSIGIGVNGYDNPQVLVYEDSVGIKNDLYVSGNVYATNLTGSGGNIDTGSFATTGSNSFTGSQTILSGAIGILNNGNSTSLTDTELDIETNGTPAASYIVSFNQTASAAVISYDGATYDNELWTIADSAGIRMTDWDNGTGNLSAVPFMSVGANDGTQTPPQFQRGLGVTGDIHQSGTFWADTISFYSSSTITQTTGSYVMTYDATGGVDYATYPQVAEALQPYISGSGGNINTASFATTGSNTFIGDQILSNVSNSQFPLQIISGGIRIDDPTGDWMIWNSRTNGGLRRSNTADLELLAQSASLLIRNNAGRVYISGSPVVLNDVEFIPFSASLNSRINAITGSGGTINTGSFATTGSNTFVGTQNFNENIYVSASKLIGIGNSSIRGDLNGITIFDTNGGYQNRNFSSGEFYIQQNTNAPLYIQSTAGNVVAISGSSTYIQDVNFIPFSSSLDSRINGIVTGTGFATTGSNTFTGSQTINGGNVTFGTTGSVATNGINFANSKIYQNNFLNFETNGAIGIDFSANGGGSGNNINFRNTNTGGAVQFATDNGYIKLAAVSNSVQITGSTGTIIQGVDFIPFSSSLNTRINAITGSGGSSFPYTGSANISGSLNLIGPLSVAGTDGSSSIINFPFTYGGSTQVPSQIYQDSNGDIVLQPNAQLVISGSNGNGAANLVGNSPLLNFSGDLNGAGAQYPQINLNTDAIAYAADGVYAAYQINDSEVSGGGYLWFGMAANSYTAEYGPETVSWVGGGANNSNGSNTAFIMRTGSADLEVFKPIIANYPITFTPQGAPTSPTPGTMYFSNSDSHFYGWNGSAWKQLDNNI